MVMSGRSVNLTTLFLGRFGPPKCKWLTSTKSLILLPVTDNILLESVEGVK